MEKMQAKEGRRDLQFLQEGSLFAGVAAEDLQGLYHCLGARELNAPRDTFVFRRGEKVRYVYYILAGSVHIIDEDFWGNRSIIETMPQGTLFGEAYVFSGMEEHLTSVIAAEDSVILEMAPEKLFETCSKGCSCHTVLVRNALGIVSTKIVLLTAKLGHIMRRTIREKLLSYLSACAQQAQNSAFHIPYSRQQLADYLCVDRSALSHELSRLKKQGVIRYHKSYFELLVEQDEV